MSTRKLLLIRSIEAPFSNNFLIDRFTLRGQLLAVSFPRPINVFANQLRRAA